MNDNDLPMRPDGGAEAGPDWEALIERYHHLSTKTRNPLYAWLALEARFHSRLGLQFEQPFGDEFSVPGWVASYLLDVVQSIATMAGGIDPQLQVQENDTPKPILSPVEAKTYSSPEEYMQSPEFQAHMDRIRITPGRAMNKVPAALGLTRNGGWNAFASLKATSAKMHEFHSYEAMRAAGVPAKVALDAIGSVIGVEDPSHMNRRLREGRDLTKDVDVAKPDGLV